MLALYTALEKINPSNLDEIKDYLNITSFSYFKPLDIGETASFSEIAAKLFKSLLLDPMDVN